MIQTPTPRTTSPLPLRDGERLSQTEFHRRYASLPHINKAQLIEGIVYMPSPVRFTQHGQPQSDLSAWLVWYKINTPGTNTGTNCTLILDERNEVQPDAMMFWLPEFGGAARINDDGYIVGAPELVVEIAGSTLERDIGPKRAIYERLGVQEYLLWNVADEQIEWWQLHDGHYELIPSDEHGICRSSRFPGLWLNVPALLRRDSATLIQSLQLGIQQRASITNG